MGTEREQRNQNEEIRRQGEQEPDDPITAREELELELMDEGESEAGEDIGDETG